MSLHVTQWGAGEPVLLVHGSVQSGVDTWKGQRPLADEWRLIIVDRHGMHPNPPGGEDFDADAEGLAALLTGPMHVVAHSYGGIGAMLAAARRPERVRSLTLSEPPAFGAAPDDPVVSAFAERLRAFWRDGPLDPEAFLRAFVAAVGGALDLPDPLPAPLLQNAAALRAQRFPGEARIPLEQLRAAPFPMLVISGGHSPAFDALCDALQRATGAERAVVPGAGHSIPLAERYNHVLVGMLRRASATAGVASR